MVHVDYLTVVVAAIVYMIIATLWYSPYLFGNLWLQIKGKNKIRKRLPAYFFQFFAALLLSYFLSLIEVYLAATSFWDGVIAGFVLYLGFVFPTQITSVIWEKNTFKLFMIDNICWLLSFMVMGGILVG